MPVYWNLEPTRVANGNQPSKCLHIGLINNMPNGALQATERQFISLLSAAAEGIDVRVSIYALPDVPRSESSLRYINASYCRLEQLWESKLDGLIVTGTEPLAANLQDEPYWHSLTKVLEWADQNTYSSIWSCLAAHAAVLHLDGIYRKRLTDKRFGIFDCSTVSNHELTSGTPANIPIPHSRWNDISENDLLARGYQMVTKAQDGGVDAFIKQQASLLVFFQGHPEYEGNTLLLEYRRDVSRYLRGEQHTYPKTPVRYFDQTTDNIFAALREKALLDRTPDLLNELPTAFADKRLVAGWHTAATRIYSNWLNYLRASQLHRTGTLPNRKTLARETSISRTSFLAATE